MKRFLLALAIAAFAPATVMAQEGSHRVGIDRPDYGPVAGDLEMSVGLGGAAFDEDLDEGAVGPELSIGYFLTDNIAVGVRQFVGVYDEEQEREFNGATRAFVDYHLRFLPHRVFPYVGLTAGGTYGDEIKQALAVGAELGLKGYIWPKTFIFGGAGYQALVTDWEGFQEDSNILFNGGVGFNF
jgi:hypothetical protein